LKKKSCWWSINKSARQGWSVIAKTSAGYLRSTCELTLFYSMYSFLNFSMLKSFYPISWRDSILLQTYM
jgi:hypothetical protein